MDATELLILDAEVSAGVLGNGQDFVLIDLNAPADPAVNAEAARRGFAWCGVVVLKQGRLGLEVCPNNPEAGTTMLLASLAFAQAVAPRIADAPNPEGDGAEWLNKLFALPDSRAVN